MVQTVCAQFVWESQCRVVVDFAPGAGMLAKAALANNAKVLCVCMNQAHAEVLKRLLKEYILSQVKNETLPFASSQQELGVDALRPPRLAAVEQLSKRLPAAPPEGEPPAKRSAPSSFDSTIDAALAGMVDSPPSPKAAPPKEAPPKGAPHAKKAPAAKKASSSAKSASAVAAKAAAVPSEAGGVQPASSISDALAAWK